MIIYLKEISEECFSFNVNVNFSLKFLRTLGGLSEGTEALGHSEGTQRAFRHLRHSGNRAIRALRYLKTWALRALRHLESTRALKHLGTQALRHSSN